MPQNDALTRRAAIAAGASTWALLGGPGLAALANGAAPQPEAPPPRKAAIYFHPAPLQPQDKVALGPAGAKEIVIRQPTLLAWVDQAPDARFAHPTLLVLITADGVQVEKGDWWPMLNGQPLFRNGARPAAVLAPA